jgi:F0F1-type ATP synthase assembly protein I
MSYLIIKYLLTALAIVVISEAAKLSDKLGGLVAALPLITIISLIWLYIEQQPTAKIANHAYYTFWYVIPTLPMFPVFAWMLPRFGFWPTLLTYILITAVLFYGYAQLLKIFNIHLL